MLDFIAGLCGYLMNFICSIVQNYGLAIVVFTILVKLLLIPLTHKQQKSLEKAQKMQTIMQDLQKKYGQDQERFMLEYQKALKENDMNMLTGMGCSGCLINLIQLPILLGMFYMMVSPLTHIMKMDQEEILKYKNEIIDERKQVAITQLYEVSGDLLTEEGINAEIAKINEADDSKYIDPRYYEIDIIKEKEIMDLEFFGINLGEVASKNKDNKILLIIPGLSMLFTYLSLAINNMINKRKGIVQPKPEDMEVPVPDMRVMNIMMPLMLGYVAYSIPQGVGLYWALSNFIGVIQIVVQRMILDPEFRNGKTKQLAEKNEIHENKTFEVNQEKEVKQENIEKNKKTQNSNKNNKNKNGKNKGKKKK